MKMSSEAYKGITRLLVDSCSVIDSLIADHEQLEKLGVKTPLLNNFKIMKEQSINILVDLRRKAEIENETNTEDTVEKSS